MPFITREDGERFVIPSYRDVLTTPQSSQLKREILLLSQNYGEYITLQRKAKNQYEVAFSNDTGYLLGESVWHYFQRPLDLVYVEAIPNTTDAILVIVKNGSVYLDGRFPLDSIPEELIIFLTQQNHFEIYTYGDVPISEKPEAGKFSFEPNSVKSFAVLENPVFPTLPLVKIYQLQRVDTVLKQQGIGVFPLKPILIGIIAIGLLWMFWSYIREEEVKIIPQAFTPNPYANFTSTLTAPPINEELIWLLKKISIFGSLPGWSVTSIAYNNGSITAHAVSNGGNVNDLLAWATVNQFGATIDDTGVTLKTNMVRPLNRNIPDSIHPLQDAIARIIDNIAEIYPGNNIKLAKIENKGVYSQQQVTVNLTQVSPVLFRLISLQFRELPAVLQNVTLTLNSGNFSGTINILVLGS